MGRPATVSRHGRRYADQLLTNVEELVARVQTSVDLAAAAARQRRQGLLDEVATGKVTGEEERYSHTDLWDFAANVEGSQGRVDGAAAASPRQDADLARRDRPAVRRDRRPSCDSHRAGDGCVLYDQLDQTQLQRLSRQRQRPDRVGRQVAGGRRRDE